MGRTCYTPLVSSTVSIARIRDTKDTFRGTAITGQSD